MEWELATILSRRLETFTNIHDDKIFPNDKNYRNWLSAGGYKTMRFVHHVDLICSEKAIRKTGGPQSSRGERVCVTHGVLVIHGRPARKKKP